MWSPWRRSPSCHVQTRPSQPSNFSCSSFKDVQSLFADDEDDDDGRQPQPQPQQHQNPRQSLLLRRRSIFHRVRLSAAVLRRWSADPDLPPVPRPSPCLDLPIYLPASQNRVVLYSTSLRVVRKTFDDCRAVQSILRGFRVSIDERDLAMDGRFGDELRRILGHRFRSPTLPRVFIGGRYVGGADDVVRLHESGELKEFIQVLGLAEAGAACEECGGHGFVLCENCSGSHKAYDEKRMGFRICSDCNENGLIRCSSCVSSDPPTTH